MSWQDWVTDVQNAWLNEGLKGSGSSLLIHLWQVRGSFEVDLRLAQSCNVKTPVLLALPNLFPWLYNVMGLIRSSCSIKFKVAVLYDTEVRKHLKVLNRTAGIRQEKIDGRDLMMALFPAWYFSLKRFKMSSTFFSFSLLKDFKPSVVRSFAMLITKLPMPK